MKKAVQPTIKLLIVLCIINGSGANAHPSAILDLDNFAGGNNKGLLIPRISLTTINVSAIVTSPAKSLLVYNTVSAGSGTNAVSPCYYYWDGTNFIHFAYNLRGNISYNWNSVGISGTNAGANFIQAIDSQDLMFKHNSLEKMRIQKNCDVGIGTNIPTYKLYVPISFIRTDYINTSENIVTSGVNGLVVKAGDDFHRINNADSVLLFLRITPPNGDYIGGRTASTILKMNYKYIDNVQISSRFTQGNNTSTSYIDVPIQIWDAPFGGTLSNKPPRISFHWTGIVVSQIGINNSEGISILNIQGGGTKRYYFYTSTCDSIRTNSNSNKSLLNNGGPWSEAQIVVQPVY